ncbi:MAG: bifunctional riboflavin kinase/FAD synthetase [Clostridia bacterium]|nr:bifunctional riboflavin kinase/FAD synthetase [Clostridia bacterium]
MRYIHDTQDFTIEDSTVVTLGKFDGVHLGHQKLLGIVKEKAGEYGAKAAAFTFDHIPVSLCSLPNQSFIMTNMERRKVMETLGMDILIEYPFTNSLMNMEAEDFLRNVVKRQLNARCVVVGTDYTFGKDKRGTAGMIAAMADEMGFEAVVVEKECYENREISSTYVRDELRVGHMETVNMLLGRPYFVCGVVAKGSQIGRTMELPTINIYPPAGKLLPPNGVYASVTLVDGEKFYGVTNVGIKPTVKNSSEISVETFLFGFSGDVYGSSVEVQLKHFQRPEMKFDDIDALHKQIDADVAFAKELFLI